ncbi:hypothetical protein F4810DRAFT_712010 [Camillea tinctor]|nr:hypothetical protein F4810DRAFT_712010 [Camillea tinctor]
MSAPLPLPLPLLLLLFCFTHSTHAQPASKRGPIANTYIDPINPVWLATFILIAALLGVAAVLSVLHARSVRKVERLLKAQQQHIELDEFAARNGHARHHPAFAGARA